MKRADFDRLTFGDAWEGVRLLALLITAYRSGERFQSDRSVENFARRIEQSEAWLRERGLLYGQEPRVANRQSVPRP